MTLQWEAAFGKNFTIDVSDDASSWKTLTTITNNVSFTNNLSLKGSGRYVRMNGTAAGTISVTHYIRLMYMVKRVPVTVLFRPG